MSDETQPCQNNDKVLYREKHSDHWGSFDDSLFVTEGGGIGIDVAGMVYVMPLKEWHKLKARVGKLEKALKAILDQPWIENALATQWAARIAKAALAEDGGK